jgi:hypothetical protein
MNPDLFIGVVTYPGTRFPESSGSKGLAQSLARGIEASNGTCVVEIHGQDVYKPSLLTIDQEEISKSIDAELATELEWRRHVTGTNFHPIAATKLKVHRSLRRKKFLTADDDSDPVESAGFRMVRRLVNIEFAHLTLMRNALNAGAAWILIIEDDAAIDQELLSVEELAKSLVEFGERAAFTSTPSFVNISRSHSDSELGTARIYVDQAEWAPKSSPDIRAQVAERPVTNTVCAILYRREFLAGLLDEMTRIPLSPVLPIDWKLNQALMNMTKRNEIGLGSCWSLSPAPIVQGSMHTTGGAEA